jgi:hypothetical protein
MARQKSWLTAVRRIITGSPVEPECGSPSGPALGNGQQ